LILDEASAQALLSQPVVVEEKLDGANVMLWMDDGRVQAATRGGPGARDRAGQLGPLRAWAASHAAELRPLLTDQLALYAEWMWLTHSVAYHSLPSHLVGFDLYSPQGFLAPAARDRAFAEARIAVPPRLFSGTLHRRERVDELLGSSRYGDSPAEGVIVRVVTPGDADARLAKVVASSFQRRSDAHWRQLSKRNALSA